MNAFNRRQFFRLSGSAALATMALSVGLARATTEPSPNTVPASGVAGDPLALVDPELRPVVTGMQQRFGDMPPLSADNLAERRQMQFQLASPLPDVPVAERIIPGPADAPELTVYVINAGGEGTRPAILHTHGGGFISGSAKADVPNLQAIAKQLDCVIVTVEYRLAPETTYAGSIEDNYAGLRWLHANATELGVDPGRIAVMGESAGGGHAALLAITARDRGEVPVLFQLLVYPMLDDRTGSSRPVPGHIGQLVWTAESNRFGWRSFLGQAPGSADVPAAAVPARTQSMVGLPPTFIGVGALDLFVDEDIEYARRLVNAGVPTQLVVVPGAFHGFDMIARHTDIASRFNDAKINALRRAFQYAGQQE